MIQKQTVLQRDWLSWALLLVLGLGGWLLGQPDDSAEVIRLHVFADSDSVYDQQVKGLVRDAVLDYIETLPEVGQSAEGTAAALRGHLSEISEVASGVAALYGCTARTDYGVFSFSQRDWGQRTMPAGHYEALRIRLGDGGGHNWFCVLYPELTPRELRGELTFTEEETADGKSMRVRLGSLFARWFF